RAKEVFDIEIEGLKKTLDSIGKTFTNAVRLMLDVTTGGGGVVVKGVGKGCVDSPNSQDFDVELEKVFDCRVTGNDTAKMRVYTLPAFAGYADGDTIAKKLVQGMAMEPIVLPFYSAYTDVEFITSSLPNGLSVKSDGNAIVISGKPTVSGEKTAKITLIGNGGEIAATIQIAFATTSLDEINPAAARYTSFTGRVLDENGMTVGIVSLVRGASEFALKSTGIVEIEDVLDDWRLAADNVVTTGKEGVASITLPPSGEGFGALVAEDGKTYDITFRGNLESVSNDDYLGSYNIYLQAEDNCGKYYGYGFLQMNIAVDGSVSISGELPDGEDIPAVVSHMTFDEENGLVPFYAETESGSSIGGALRIVPALHRQEGEGCVSSCDSIVALKWSSAADEGKVIGITLCGVAYDTTRSVTEQMKGEDGTVFSLNFYAVWDSQRSSKTVVPANVRKQGLLSGVTIAESNAGKSFEPQLPEGIALYPGQKLTFSVDESGKISGSFKLLKNDTAGTLETVDFCGIFIPYQASCCGEVPPALAYGHFLYGGKSWSILVIPYVTADFNALKELKISINSSTSGINLKTSGSTTGSLRALVSANGVEALAVDNKNFTVANTKTITGKRISAVNVDYGMMVVPTCSFEYNVVALSLTKLLGSDTEATSGMFALALPEDMNIITPDSIPDGATFYIYDASKRVFMQCLDRTNWQPGQAFFVYFGNPNTSITLRLCTTASNGEETQDAGKVVFQGEPEKAEGTMTYWDPQVGIYSSKGMTDPAGLRNGVWLKK
ncbi:MAG: hypothetical protein MJ106_05680, partial [Lentisphaeria bacterium]|nr:hypothetical protein [Lentisphaeria bacterium]